MSLWQNVSLVLVGLLWGATNPFIRQGTVGVDKITADSKFKKTLLEWKFLITRWQYIVPFLLNQSGSILYFYALQNADLSLAVPVANSCTFLFTAFTAILLGEQKQNFKTYIGIGLITTGISICMYDKLKIT